MRRAGKLAKCAACCAGRCTDVTDLRQELSDFPGPYIQLQLYFETYAEPSRRGGVLGVKAHVQAPDSLWLRSSKRNTATIHIMRTVCEEHKVSHQIHCMPSLAQACHHA